MSDENREKALNYHSKPTPGKLRIEATKPMTSHHDLALAYSPGVAFFSPGMNKWFILLYHRKVALWRWPSAFL